MFAKTIIDSDAFVDMPLSTQALYFHLSMRADDDGFINNPKKIQRMIGASDDDLKVLCLKRFIIPFESGIVVIKHWKIHNYIRNDRYKPTVYTTEKALITSKENGAYTEVDTAGIPSDNQVVYQMDTQYRLGKVSKGKDSLVEGSVDGATTTEENKLKCIGGKLGKGVVYLSDKQFDDLLEKMGMDAFNRYVERLATFIIDKNAHIHNHHEMILKWYYEDSAVKPVKGNKSSNKKSSPSFDIEAYEKLANENTYKESEASE
jgi:hypothetical protein